MGLRGGAAHHARRADGVARQHRLDHPAAARSRGPAEHRPSRPGCPRAAAPALAPGGDLRDFTTSLQAIQRFNPHYLEFDVIDASGRIVASSGENMSARPAPHRIGTAFNLEGKTFVSEPRRSPDYNREVVYVSVPVKDASGRIVGALGTVFDLQTVFEEVIKFTKFNETGYAVVVGGDGHILAHPDSRRVGEDISSYPAVIEGMRRASGEVIARELGGRKPPVHVPADDESAEPRREAVAAADRDRRGRSAAAAGAAARRARDRRHRHHDPRAADCAERGEFARPADPRPRRRRPRGRERRSHAHDRRHRARRVRPARRRARQDDQGAAGARPRQGRLRPLHREAGGRAG